MGGLGVRSYLSGAGTPFIRGKIIRGNSVLLGYRTVLFLSFHLIISFNHFR